MGREEERGRGWQEMRMKGRRKGGRGEVRERGGGGEGGGEEKNSRVEKNGRFYD